MSNFPTISTFINPTHNLSSLQCTEETVKMHGNMHACFALSTDCLLNSHEVLAILDLSSTV
jgi:hypothetical protein